MKLTFAVTACFTGAAILGIGNANADGPQSSLIPLILPAGSTGSISGSWENWETSIPFANTVKMLRAQLPIGKAYLGVPWCSGEPFGTMQMWDWKSRSQYIMVSVNDEGQVTIFNGPDDSGRGDCD